MHSENMVIKELKDIFFSRGAKLLQESMYIKMSTYEALGLINTMKVLALLCYTF